MSSTTEESSGSSTSGSGSGGGGSCDLVEERFRVDRRKLESLMTQLVGQSVCPLERFFAEVEHRTGVQIAWPSKLKVGAKSKRDPQIKVCGRPASVQLAKALILSHCSRKFSKLTLRIDVPHAEHGQLIGRHGALQKDIKARTGTDIHFPDSNKSATATAAASSGDAFNKSNQVSLNGLCGPQPLGMETARQVIRAKQPVTLLLQLPPQQPLLPMVPDPAGHPFVRQVCATCDVTVGRQQPSAATAAAPVGDAASGWTIRGLAENAEGLARAVECLALYVTTLLRGSGASDAAASALIQPPLVRCRLDFERRHAAAVRERMQTALPPCDSGTGCNGTSGGSNVFKAALKQFGVRQFDLTDTGVVMWEAGGCRALLRLRQFVLGCLPAYLCFDMPCNPFAPEDSAIESLKGRTVDGVTIDFVVRRGSCGGNGSGGARAVTMRTHEDNALAMYRLLSRLFATPMPELPQQPSLPVQPLPLPQPPPASLLSIAGAVSSSNGLLAAPSPVQQQHPTTPQPLPSPPPTQQPIAFPQRHQPTPPPSPPQQPAQQPAPPPSPKPLSHDSRAPGAEYSRKRLEALRVMSHRPSGDRYPTSHWSGLYFSRSWAAWSSSPIGEASADGAAGSAATPADPAAAGAPYAGDAHHCELQQHHHNHSHHHHHFHRKLLQPQSPLVTTAATAGAFAQSCYQQQLLRGLPMEAAADASADPATVGGTDALLQLLSDNNLADCATAMVTNEIDLQTFLTLSDEDLKALELPYATRQRIHELIHSIAASQLLLPL